MDCLAIFDVDGTLTATNAVDDECYLRAVGETLDVDCGGVDWSDAPHVTDSAIARHLWSRYRGQDPDAGDINGLRIRFLEILQGELTRAPERFAPIAGAAEVFDRLRSSGWRVALATGGWRESASIKLAAAGIMAHDVPMACASDAESREQIVQLAWRDAEEANGRPFRRVVSVGDAPWDVRTARSLGLPFVGIGEGVGAERMRAEGARTIIPSLRDGAAVLEALASASIPA